MKNDILRKITAYALAAVMSVSVLTACGSKKAPELADGATTSLSDKLVGNCALKVNDTEIPAELFQYYIYSSAMNTAYGLDKSFNGDFSNFDWNQKIDGKSADDAIIDTAVENAVKDCVMIEKGKEKDIKVSDEELSKVDDDIAAYKQQSGEEMFNLSMNAMGINSSDDYKKLYAQIMGAQLVSEDISKNIDSYASDKNELKKYKSDDRATVQHILIMNNSEKHENPEETINGVLERARSGEDFVALMKEFNEDTGEPETGYTFGKNEMVKEFEEASFALDYDQISDVVKSDYGYHIIKRLVGPAELVSMWAKQAKVKKNNGVLRKMNVQNIIKAAANASRELQQKMQAMQSAAAAAGTDASSSADAEADSNTSENGDASGNE